MRNISEQSLQNGMVVLLRDIKKHQKANRTNQISPLGYLPLPQGVSTIVEVLAGVPDGAAYYSTDLLHARIKINGAWTTLA